MHQSTDVGATIFDIVFLVVEGERDFVLLQDHVNLDLRFARVAGQVVGRDVVAEEAFHVGGDVEIQRQVVGRHSDDERAVGRQAGVRREQTGQSVRGTVVLVEISRLPIISLQFAFQLNI